MDLEVLKIVELLADEMGKTIIANGDDIPDDTAVGDECYDRGRSGKYEYRLDDKP